MKILFYGYNDHAQVWLDGLSRLLPGTQLRMWQEGDDAPADYIVVRKPPTEMLQPRDGLKAIFNIGAGVDALISALSRTGLVPTQHGVMIVRLDYEAMAHQMTEYVTHAVVHHFRGFDEYARQQARACWNTLHGRRKEEFHVGILGLGTLGTHTGKALAATGFPVRGWSRSRKQVDGVPSYAGATEFDGFLDGLSVLVNMLPLTPATENILDRNVFAKLPRGAYVVNVGRGAHLVEEDLLAAVQGGHIAGARLDVCRTEPLPADHPFWSDPRISVTPHIASSIVLEESVKEIAEKIRALEMGQSVSGVVDWAFGY